MMKKSAILYVILTISLLLSTSVFALDKLITYVNDEAGVISPAYEQLIHQELYDLWKNSSVEMAVAIVTTTGGVAIEEYSIGLAHQVLGDREKDNGLLILLAVEDRAYRIEVGYGLEPILPDLLAAAIGNQVMGPKFRDGNYEQGLLDGVKEISAVIRGDSSWETEGDGAGSSNLSAGAILNTLLPFMFLFLVIGINIFAGYKMARKKMKEKKKRGEETDAGDFIAAMFIASMFGRGGRGGFGGLGGGFGGFSGGGFGGGGFSGRF